VYKNTSIFEGVQQPKESLKTPETLCLARYHCDIFKIWRLAPQTKLRVLVSVLKNKIPTDFS